jgi:hypothetical protein
VYFSVSHRTQACLGRLFRPRPSGLPAVHRDHPRSAHATLAVGCGACRECRGRRRRAVDGRGPGAHWLIRQAAHRAVLARLPGARRGPAVPGGARERGDRVGAADAVDVCRRACRVLPRVRACNAMGAVRA